MLYQVCLFNTPFFFVLCVKVRVTKPRMYSICHIELIFPAYPVQNKLLACFRGPVDDLCARTTATSVGRRLLYIQGRRFLFCISCLNSEQSRGSFACRVFCLAKAALPAAYIHFFFLPWKSITSPQRRWCAKANRSKKVEDVVTGDLRGCTQQAGNSLLEKRVVESLTQRRAGLAAL